MIRIAKESDIKKIAELRKKINNADYLKAAIQSLAQDLTNNLLEEETIYEKQQQRQQPKQQQS